MTGLGNHFVHRVVLVALGVLVLGVVTAISGVTGIKQDDLYGPVIGVGVLVVVLYTVIDWYNNLRTPRVNERRLTEAGEGVWAERNAARHFYAINAGQPCPNRKATSPSDTAYPPFCVSCATGETQDELEVRLVTDKPRSTP